MRKSVWSRIAASMILLVAGHCFTAIPARAEEAFPAVVAEAEDFVPQSPSGQENLPGWKVVKNGEGNYMVDIIGFSHISGERVLSAPALAKDAIAVKDIQIPATGTYRVWSRFEQPTNTENRFRIEVRQNGKVVGGAVMGEKNAPKYFFGSNTPVGQADPSWGSEGLVEQGFDITGLQAGAAQLVLTAVDQSALAAPRANRNVDLVFLTQDLTDSWRAKWNGTLYPILNATLAATPPRYFLRLSSPIAQSVSIQELWNRVPWYLSEKIVALVANTPSEWIPLTMQDVAHFTTLQMVASATPFRAEIATAPDDKKIMRTLDWNDPLSNQLLVALPPYPNKYPGEKIITVEEQYLDIIEYFKTHPSKVGKDPKTPVAWGGWIPAFEKGRVGDAAAEMFNAMGIRGVASLLSPDADSMKLQFEANKVRFLQWKIPLGRNFGVGAYRQAPTAENVAAVKKAATSAGVLPYLQRFDYGDEIQFTEWLAPITTDDMNARFAVWQQKHGGKIEFQIPDSSAKTAIENPKLYIDSLRFYEDTARDYVAQSAREIPRQLGEEVHYGANVAAHPFYYPEIAKYIKWFRKTEDGDYAANFGRHSEYFWQVGQPGPLVNAYVADHFRAGMRDNPDALFLQYTMPHSPGNSDKSFRRTAFSHLAHGAKGLDYFGVGVNNSFTENYIDFRDKERFAAIRDIDRSMATIEDMLPASKVVPSRVALILSDSTERWDFAGIAGNKASFSVFSDDYQKTRLAYHEDRLGIYYALVHASRPPDLLIEEDVQAGNLKDYDVAYWVGDCAEAATVNALQSWIENGGHLVSTAGALRNDEYKTPVENGLKLLGLQSAKLDARTWFFRPQIELPRLEPIDTINNDTGKMPVLALKDDIAALPTARVLASFGDGKAAVVENAVGKGSSTYIAALPGVAYLWGAYQAAGGKEFVPARGPSSHLDLTGFDATAKSWIVAPALKVMPSVDAGGAKIDARLIASPAGYFVPISNYESDTTKSVTFTIRGAQKVRNISSAAAGKLKFTAAPDGALTFSYKPGIGDILRLDTAR